MTPLKTPSAQSTPPSITRRTAARSLLTPSDAGGGATPLSQAKPASERSAIAFANAAKLPEASPREDAESTHESDWLTLDQMMKGLSKKDLQAPALSNTPTHTDTSPEAPQDTVRRNSNSPRKSARHLLGFRLHGKESEALKTKGVDRIARSERPSPRNQAANTGDDLANRPGSWWAGSATASAQARVDLSDARAFLRCESLLIALLKAVENGELKTINDHLATVPSEVENFETHFPPAPLNLAYDVLLTMATEYDARMQTVSSARLVTFINDCKLHRDAQFQVVSDHELLSDATINKTYAPEVADLCLAFRDHSASELNSAPRLVVEKIALAMKRPRLVQALAMQPYANLTDMQLKCEVLATRVGAAVMGGLIAKIVEARALQMHASSMLQEHLLQEIVDPRRVATLALVEYAKQMTSAPVDHVSAGATWAEVSDMHSAMQQVLERYVAMPPETVGAERVAIRWVAAQISATHNQTPAWELQGIQGQG